MKYFERIIGLFKMQAARATIGLVAMAVPGILWCDSRPVPVPPAQPGFPTPERISGTPLTKLDILLAIDNSPSMADKQQILAAAVPDLIRQLVNPRCIDDNSPPTAAMMQPAGPLEACPVGFTREFTPITDIHIGVISSSIGGHGADACPNIEPNNPVCNGLNTTNNDKGHLLSRSDICGTAEVPTYLDRGFLAWDPSQKLSPPGEAVLDDGTNGLVPALRDMVIGVGQIGCKYESQLESWYRFLADPEPYLSIAMDPMTDQAVPSPQTDAALLAQRAEFLRPDSLLAILMITDENDCSIKEYGQFPDAGQQEQDGMPFRLPRARQECTTKGPNDPCCLSCGQNPGSCPPDPTCTENGEVALLPADADDFNLRCYDQKRRFGIDFLYPTDRYVQALTSLTIPDRTGQLVPNPIFWDLDPTDEFHTIRDPGLVFLAGIVGVPWQDIARDPADLTKGFKSADELAITDPGFENHTVWDIILGDPAADVKPLDPLMIESITPRSGYNYVTGAPLVPPGSSMSNPINGSEWNIPNNDLQYACIFPLTLPKDCSNPATYACDCDGTSPENPLCDLNPDDGMNPTLQRFAKAYPSLRELSVLKGLGSQGIAGSICPSQTLNISAADYGYRPAIGALVDRMKAAWTSHCAAKALPVGEDGLISCAMLEARNTGSLGCDCDAGDGRQPVSAEYQQSVEAILQDPAAPASGWNCICAITQLLGDKRDACQSEHDDIVLVGGETVNGWCYIDATTSPPTGNPELVADCPPEAKRAVRRVGEPTAGATMFFACAED